MKPRHVLPRRFWRHGPQGSWAEQLGPITPRQAYLLEQSTRRYERRHGPVPPLPRGEIGQLAGFRIVRSEPPAGEILPHPDELLKLTRDDDDSFFLIV